MSSGIGGQPGPLNRRWILDLGQRNALLNGLLFIAFAVLLTGGGLLYAMLPEGGLLDALGLQVMFPVRGDGATSGWLSLFVALGIVFLLEGGMWQLRTGRTFRRLKAKSPVDLDSQPAPALRRILDPIVGAAIVLGAGFGVLVLLIGFVELFWSGQLHITPVAVAFVAVIAAYIVFRLRPLLRRRHGD
ncbi:MAG: hypothetical protein CMM50_14930 [Rhodospirillaceae bacterium]|nr:hypothetical protein [Rhodospirillaceae bacterium]|tara:strand:+ start:1063 stop:1626 length:564 start_codon:yes stop_codon:yes gene_type:complete